MASPSGALVTGKNRAQPAPAAKTAAGRQRCRERRNAAGEAAELFIILPPNFEQAIARGKIMLVLEAEMSEGTVSD